MADSVKLAEEECVRRIHSRDVSGHIHKGHGVVAANSSIPTKYQTIVTDNTDKKGFLTKAKRFQADVDLTEAPGPGNYLKHTKVDNSSPSLSKKGTGGFASKSKRGVKFSMSAAPGPGTYFPQLANCKCHFDRETTTRPFRLPIAKTVDKTNGIPAPNEYKILMCKFGKKNNVSAEAAFKSQSKREMINLKDAHRMPAPGQYTIKDSLLHESPVITESSFKSRTIRKTHPDPPDFPGPGTYLPSGNEEPPKKLLFPRKHYLCISAPAMPLPPAPPTPGPGSYEMVDYDGPTKHFMSSSAFVSATSRWSGDVLGMGTALPGPAHYRPVEMGKQSFIYNVAGRWI
ncbi:O(6)-methylguanine-induced apoptosis 2-like [Gigantopelta aegis]|uniref:O(6)-methylguanine-induced apoptosis 2-like n=1 Tax=Gigantopelta aegis TaxID=1735272 RepID=UPI001B88AD0B|nr:O(6)-methylguanine-induced apoptosis 2-like [Gigantopelta aegis]